MQYFFTSKFPEYRNNPFLISGESYAGKYIPDLASRIDRHNLQTKADDKINLKAVFIGNGVMDFTDDSLEKSTIEYFIDHDFLDPETLEYWSRACQHDEESAGCQFFLERAEETLDDINPYSIFYLTQTFTATASTMTHSNHL